MAMERRPELKHDKIIQLNAFTRNITRLKKQSDLFFLHFIVILDMQKCKNEGYVPESSSPSFLSKNEQEKNTSDHPHGLAYYMRRHTRTEVAHQERTLQEE